MKEGIISTVRAVNLRGIAHKTVFSRKVEIAHTVASGSPRIASFVENELSLIAAQSAIEALHEQTKEKFNEMDKLLPAGTDLSSLALEYLETEQGGDVHIMDLAMEILVLPVVSNFLVSSSSANIPRIISDLFVFFGRGFKRTFSTSLRN